jgi:hypothetical protein
VVLFDVDSMLSSFCRFDRNRGIGWRARGSRSCEDDEFVRWMRTLVVCLPSSIHPFDRRRTYTKHQVYLISLCLNRPNRIGQIKRCVRLNAAISLEAYIPT